MVTIWLTNFRIVRRHQESLYIKQGHRGIKPLILYTEYLNIENFVLITEDDLTSLIRKKEKTFDVYIY